MEFLETIKESLGSRIDKSGAAFYSSKKTLIPGKFLIIGLNPGGKPSELKSTIRDSLKDMESENYNAYTNQNWDKYSKGNHPLQKNLIKLFMHLGYDINQVCATNLIYERSSRETDLTLEQFDCYKPLLLRTFDLVMPTVVIAFGKKPLLVLQEQFSRLLSRHDFPSGHGTWKISIIKGVIRGRNVTVIGLPHLSRYSLVNRIDQLRLIKDACT